QPLGPDACRAPCRPLPYPRHQRGRGSRKDLDDRPLSFRPIREKQPEAKRIHRSSLIPTNDTVASFAPLSLLSPASVAPEFYASIHSGAPGRVHLRRFSSINLAVFAYLEIPHGRIVGNPETWPRLLLAQGHFSENAVIRPLTFGVSIIPCEIIH